MILRSLFNQSPSPDTPLERDPSALSDIERQLHSKRTRTLFDQKKEVRDVLGGIAVRFSGTMACAERIFDFIRYERRCSPFLTFDLMFEPVGRGVWLYIGGSEEAQDHLNCWYERLNERSSSAGRGQRDEESKSSGSSCR